ncbi:MAG: rod shape-determining protein MreC [Candidatus Paceibacterota bacterium]
MSYLQDKKDKRKKFYYIFSFLVILFVLFYFRNGVFKNLSYLSHTVSHPFLVAGNNIGEKFGSIGSFFASKSKLTKENQDLKSKLSDAEAQMVNYSSLLAENTKLRDTLGRKDEKQDFILSAILAKPNQSPYDTLIIDGGTNKVIKTGQAVFASGNVPIGKISDVFSDSSKVILFSNSGEKTQVVLSGKDVFLDLVGRGGGNFEMIIPRDLSLVKGDQVVLPGIIPHVVATVATVISDPRDPFIKALLISPINIQELKFVEIGK